MGQQQIIQEMIKFNKSLMDNTFNSITTIQDQSTRMFTTFMDKAAWLSLDKKKEITDMVSAFKEKRDDFKIATDKKYEEATNYFMKKESDANPKMKKK